MSADTEAVKLKLPSSTKMERIREALTEDEDWRFGRIKMEGKKPRFELPAPTSDEPDNVEIQKTFCGVVLVAKKNFYQSDEDKEAGNEPKEKRALYIIRVGKYMPELLYVSPTAIRNWKYFAREVVQSGKSYYEVMCEFTAEQIKGKQYTWSKPKFAIARTLTEDEAAHVKIIRELVSARASEYEDNAELDKYEDEALSVDKSKNSEGIREEDIPGVTTASVEDDTPDAPVAKAKKPVDEDEDEAPKAKKPIDEDEAEAPKAKKAKKKAVDEDEDEEKPKSPARAGYPSLDEDEDDSIAGM